MRRGPALVTGLGGTLAPRVAARLRAAGWDIQRWDRSRVDPDDTATASAHLRALAPAAIVHLGTGSTGFAATLARHAQASGAAMVCVSSAMVFDAAAGGPHHPGDAISARDDYGRHKAACEAAVAQACPAATIARIGWQIDPTMPGNNMLHALDRWQADSGEVAASRAWTPACSFIDDTAQALVGLVQRRVGGVVHLDSNAESAWRFDALVRALALAFGRGHWRIRVHEDYRHDQRLLGTPAASKLPPLERRLKAPETAG